MGRLNLFACLILPGILMLTSPVAAQIVLSRSVAGNGGGELNGANHSATGTLGQPCIGIVDGPATTHEIGFWYPTDRVETTVEQGQGDLPLAFSLGACYPNPSKSTSTVQFAVPEPAHVAIAIYDVRGRVVRILLDATLVPGHHSLVLDGRGLPVGIYFTRMSAAGFVETRRLILLR